MKGLLLIASVVLCLSPLAPGGLTFAQEAIPAGINIYELDPAQSFEDLSNLSGMCGGCQVIGNPEIPLRGIPLESSPQCPGANLGNTDTMVRRLSDTPPLFPGQDFGVPIIIVELHLESVQPFEVSCQGDTQLWTLDIGLIQNQPSGGLQIHKTHPNGGTFDTTLRVKPRFTFTRIDVNPPEVVCTAQPGDHIYMGQGPWVHQPQGAPVLELPGCTTNFFPGVDQAPLTPTIVGFGVGAPHGFLYFFPTRMPVSDAADPGSAASAPQLLLTSAPNPFRGTTTLSYTIDFPSNVELTIFNVGGRVVRTLVAGRAQPGRHHVTWDGRDDRGHDVATGLYSCVVRAGDAREVRKIALVR